MGHKLTLYLLTNIFYHSGRQSTLFGSVILKDLDSLTISCNFQSIYVPRGYDKWDQVRKSRSIHKWILKAMHDHFNRQHNTSI